MPEKSIRARCCRGQAAADAGAKPVFERHWNGGLLALKTLLGIYQTKCPDLSNQVSAYSQDTQIPNALAAQTEWEQGIGTYDAGTNTIARTYGVQGTGVLRRC